MASTVSMTITELYSTMFRQVNRFNSTPPAINKILITDDSDWRYREGLAGKIAATDSYVGVMVPYSVYSPMVANLGTVDHTDVVYSEICSVASKMSNKNLYKLQSLMRELAVYKFDATAAAYELETAGGNNDVTLTARVPGEVGNDIYTSLANGGSVAVNVADYGSGTDNKAAITYVASTTTAEEFTSAVNAGATQSIVVATYEGDGSGAMNCAETASGTISIAFHKGATVSGTEGTTVGGLFAMADCPADAATGATAGVKISSIFSGAEANTYVVNVTNQGGTTPISVSWTSPVLTVLPETSGGSMIGTVSSIAAWFDARGGTTDMPFSCSYYGTATSPMVTSTSVNFTGGKARNAKYFSWKSIYVYRTKESDPEFVIIGANQAKALGFI
jgi:hypothetical protein